MTLLKLAFLDGSDFNFPWEKFPLGQQSVKIKARTRTNTMLRPLKRLTWSMHAPISSRWVVTFFLSSLQSSQHRSFCGFAKQSCRKRANCLSVQLIVFVLYQLWCVFVFKVSDFRLCVCLCVLWPSSSDSSETTKVTIIKLGTETASDMNMHPVLLYWPWPSFKVTQILC